MKITTLLVLVSTWKHCTKKSIWKLFLFIKSKTRCKVVYFGRENDIHLK